MAVSAHSDNDHAQSARALARDGSIDMREGGRANGGSHVYEGERLVTGWHSHDMHQIEYAVEGLVEVETDAGKFLLPPQQAAWIPAGCWHTATLHPSARTIAVLFDAEMVPAAGDRVRILAVAPLIREMIIHALRWPITRIEPDPVADTYFLTLAHLVADTLEHESPLSLPTSADPLVAAAIEHTQSHLASVTSASVSRSVGASERTLRRRFESALGMSWRSYLLQARLLRAMALLAEPTLSVLEVSVAVGFDNPSSFARAFVRHCGESPSAYRRRSLAVSA